MDEEGNEPPFVDVVPQRERIMEQARFMKALAAAGRERLIQNGMDSTQFGGGNGRRLYDMIRNFESQLGGYLENLENEARRPANEVEIVRNENGENFLNVRIQVKLDDVIRNEDQRAPDVNVRIGLTGNEPRIAGVRVDGDYQRRQEEPHLDIAQELADIRNVQNRIGGMMLELGRNVDRNYLNIAEITQHVNAQHNNLQEFQRWQEEGERQHLIARVSYLYNLVLQYNPFFVDPFLNQIIPNAPPPPPPAQPVEEQIINLVQRQGNDPQLWVDLYVALGLPDAAEILRIPPIVERLAENGFVLQDDEDDEEAHDEEGDVDYEEEAEIGINMQQMDQDIVHRIQELGNNFFNYDIGLARDEDNRLELLHIRDRGPNDRAHNRLNILQRALEGASVELLYEAIAESDRRNRPFERVLLETLIEEEIRRRVRNGEHVELADLEENNNGFAEDEGAAEEEDREDVQVEIAEEAEEVEPVEPEENEDEPVEQPEGQERQEEPPNKRRKENEEAEEASSSSDNNRDNS